MFVSAITPVDNKIMAEEVNRTQQLIRNMNEEFSSGTDVTTPPSAESVSTETTPPDNTPPAAIPKAPATPKTPQQPPATPETESGEKINSDPLFLKNKQEATPTTVTPPVLPAIDDDIPQEKLYAHLSKMTNGTIKDEKAWVGFINSYNELVEEAQKGWQPKYASEQAKRVHQLLSQSVGSEPATAIRILRALQFNPEGKSSKDVLFQAYLHDPRNADLTELTAKDFFEAEYETKYELLNKPDEELTPEQKRAKIAMQREQQLAVRDAQASIKKIQDEFATADEGPKKVDKQVTDAISKAVGGFQGLKLGFTDNPQETEFLNVPFTDPQAKQELLEEILNPDEAYNSMVEQFRKEDGNMDWDALARESYERKNHKEIAKQSFEHGLKLGQLTQINKIKNASSPKDISKSAAPAAGPKKSFMDTWVEASQGRG